MDTTNMDTPAVHPTPNNPIFIMPRVWCSACNKYTSEKNIVRHNDSTVHNRKVASGANYPEPTSAITTTVEAVAIDTTPIEIEEPEAPAEIAGLSQEPPELVEPVSNGIVPVSKDEVKIMLAKCTGWFS